MMLTIFGKNGHLFKLCLVIGNALTRFSPFCHGSVSIDQCNDRPHWPQPCVMARGVSVGRSFYVIIV